MKRKVRSKNKFIAKKYFFFPVILLLSLFVLLPIIQQGQDQRIRAQTNTCTVSDADYAMDADEQELVTLINSYRQEKNLTPLKVSPKLARSAAWMARDMATNNYMAQVDKLGRDFSKRFGDCGYGGGAKWETIAAMHQSAQAVLDTWKNNSQTNTVIVMSNAKVIGVGKALNESGSPSWVVDLGGTDDSGSGVVPTTAQAQPTSLPSNDPTSAASPPDPTMSSSSSTSEVTPTLYCLGGCQTPAPSAAAAPALPVGATSGGSPAGGGGFMEFLMQLIQMIIQLFK